jgi:predicted dehydrogenase
MMDIGAAARTKRPRLAFLGVGWIGRHRMEAVLADGEAEACAICDPSPAMIEAARSIASEAIATETFEQLLETRPDGVLIATPSALHARQAIQALDSGIAVFCQKPLGINGAEVAAVVAAARRNDRLLGADFSYRHTRAMQAIRRLLREEAIGRVYAVDLTFHNAYGPDKAWFYDAGLSGGGCVMDLGVHLVDLVLWSLSFPPVQAVHAELYAAGDRLRLRNGRVEDYAQATLEFGTGQVARLTCSWKLHAGRDAVIGATFHGTEGALALSNVDGSFYDFTAELRRGTSREILASPPDAWGGRAAQDWVRRLTSARGFDIEAEDYAKVAEVLDRIYEAGTAGRHAVGSGNLPVARSA